MATEREHAPRPNRVVSEQVGELGALIVKHSDLRKHCSTCGIDWPNDNNGICRSCSAGLCCRADTTDAVAPDPPCAGSRLRGVKPS